MTDSTITILDESLNMDSTTPISLIEFNEQQKANIAAALQAVSDELIPGNNRSYSADHSLYNTNVVETISKQEDAKPIIGIPNLSNERNSNQPVLLTHNFNEFVSLTKEEPQLEENMSQLQTIMTEERIVDSVDELLKRINDDKCNGKDDADNTQESDYESIPTIEYSNFIDYICPQCNKNCGTYSRWKSHTEKEHQVYNFAWSKLRIVNRSGEKFYQCLVCKDELSLLSSFNQLQTHLIDHLPYNDYFKCNICCRKFKQIHYAKSHIKKYHQKITGAVQLELDMRFIKIFCPICQQSLLDRKSYTKHLNGKHNYVKESRTKCTKVGKDVYSCKVCKQPLVIGSVKNHMLSHEKYKSFKCALCEKESVALGNAIQHVRTTHRKR